MSIVYPTTLDSLNNTLATDYLLTAGGGTGTSGLINDLNDAIEALEAKVGVNSSAVTTSHDYKLSGVTGSDKAVSKTGTETLTNKSLTSPSVTGVLSVASAITQSGSADHIVITPGTSKLVKTSVLQQDNTSDSYKNNTVMLTGWGYVVGDGASSLLNDTITFGVTFAAKPVVIISLLGGAATATPTDQGSFTDFFNQVGNNWVMPQANSILTTGFTASIRFAEPGTLLTSSESIGYSWVAYGQLS